MPDRPLLTRAEFAERLNVHPNTTYQLHDFPAPIRLSRFIVRWHPDDVEQYLAKRRPSK